MADNNPKNLQSLLQSTIDPELIVENYIVKDLLPVGENYGSNIVDICAKIISKGKNEKLHLVGKLPPLTQVQRDMFDTPFTFRKEIFMYSKLLPFYRQLEIDSGISEEEALNISPKFYGARMSLNNGDEFDDDAAILLENLKPKGYYCVDRKIGCDLAHAKCALKALARFHALGMAAREKNPEFFKIIKENAACWEFKNPDQWIPVIEARMNDIMEDLEIKEYLEACANLLQKGTIDTWLAPPPEPWSTIIHADFWANNMLYHCETNNEPDDIKFIDFQNYVFLSPIRELTFFLTTGLDPKAIEHIDELIDFYYNNIIERLKILKCNTTPYTRESFDERLREDAKIEFSHGLTIIKVITLDVNPDNPDSRNVKSLMESAESNDNYRLKLRNFVKAYAKQGWL
uniref:CHK kinase-like domain-containing protein n=1 Tax=Bracon brevicornis TaxID=1563983 RepID=A0A6V7K3I9_9HYME